MRSSLGAFVIALGVAALLTPLVRRLATQAGAFDDPGGRRVHAQKIPRLGGIAVLAAFFAPLAVLFGLETDVANLFFVEPMRIVGLVAGGLIVATLGGLDDLRGVRAWHKLWVQSGAGVIAFFCGFRIDAVSLPVLGNLDMGIFALPITVFWIVAIVNALNLIDGLDGLAGGIAFFACITNFIVGYLNAAPLVMLLSAALAGAILGFLLYNFNPATIFMGDSGSMFLGFVLATTSMLGSAVKSSTTVAILVPIVALGVPIMDTLFAMVRRFLERRPIFSPDRGHIHHRLLDLGITHRRAVLVLYAVSIVFTAGAIAVSIGRSWEVGGALLVLSVVLVGLVRFIGYFEYLQLRRRQKSRFHSRNTERLRRAVPVAIRRIDGARALEEVRAALEELATSASLVELEVIGPEDAPVAPFQWRCPDESRPRTGRDIVTATFPMVSDTMKLRFAWLSDDGDVSPQADILLQLLADVCEARIGRAAEARKAKTTGRLRTV